MYNKHAKNLEDQWFSENEAKLIAQIKERHEIERLARAEAEKECKLKKLKEQHWMKCPKCGHDLKMIELSNIELDQCTNCEGIFFDAGELDQLLLAKESKKKTFFRALFNLEKKIFKAEEK